jgi:hypothetical protein
MGITAEPDSVSAFRHAMMSDRLFRRRHVSEVCHCSGFLLAFAASESAALMFPNGLALMSPKLYGISH